MSGSVPAPRAPEREADEPVVDEALAAAIVATVLAARAGSEDTTDQPAANRWADRAAGLRKPLSPGPDAWRFSLR